MDSATEKGSDGVSAKNNPARDALTAAINRAIEEGAPEYVNIPPASTSLCKRCGTWLNPVSVMLGPVCGTCTRKLHEQATR